ncbi:MAG: flagellar type III secretion system protein FlhB [Desulfovibrionaceae bacterium]|nr:flagellar type III secretion system protein FlhB [Desulfovibrionaceae bacterium]
MFGKQSDPSKTEKATPKRRKKQREEGNVPKSQETTKAISLAAGLIGMYLWIGTVSNEFKILYKHFFQHLYEYTITRQSVMDMAFWISGLLAKMLLPFLLFIAIIVYITLRLQVGKLWATKVFKFNLSRFNLLKGLKNILASPQALLRLFKNIIMMLIIGIVPYVVIKREFPGFLNMYYTNAEGLASYMLITGFWMVAYTLVPIFAVAAFDLWQSRYAYEEGIKMTKEEIKDERKQQEGDPIIKQQQRQKMMAFMAKRMLQDVKKADVVITNPTHYAVALYYNPAEASAPVVVAKGLNHLAEKIKDVARENNVPIRENKALAQALYKAVEIGDMIPEELFKAVASILASIWRMKNKMPGR